MKQNLEIDTKRQEAWEVQERLHVALQSQAKLFLILGQLLKTIRDEKLYKYMGDGGNDDFKMFLNHNGINQQTGYLYIRVFEYYIERLKMLEDDIIKIPLNRLQRLLPSLKKLEDSEAVALVEEFAPLTDSDYNKVVKEKHLETDRPALYRHKECGKWIFGYDKVQMCNCNDEIAIVDLSA